MKTQFSVFDLLILFGIIQGVIVSTLLFISKKNIRSNKYLALTILSFSFLTTKTLLHTLHLWDTTMFRYFPNGIELALPPLVYLYGISLISPKFKSKPYNWIHFIPFLLSQAYAFIVYFTALKTNDFYEKDIIANNFCFSEIKQLEEYLLMISLIFYLFYSYQKILVYKRWLNQTTSDSTFPDFSWLITIFRLFMAVGLLKLINHFVEIFFNFSNFSNLLWNFLIIVITGLMYFLGLKGLLLPNYTFTREETIIDDNSNSILPDSKMLDTVKQLKKVMIDDKVFLNPKLTIRELSKILDIPERNLSQAINQYFKISFRDFINNYRLEEVKSKLDDKKFSHMSILGIALESGFNSEASFYRIFRKNTGLSPKEYIQKTK